MLKSYVKNNYGDWDALFVNAGLDLDANPNLELKDAVDGFAEKLGYKNTIFDTEYQVDRTIALFHNTLDNTGDWVYTRKYLKNPYNDVDHDGILNKDEIAQGSNPNLSDDDDRDGVTNVAVDSNQTNHPPKAIFTLDKSSATLGDTITATSKSTDEDNDTLTNTWWLYSPDGTHQQFSDKNSITFQANQEGSYTVTLNVTDGQYANNIQKKISVKKTYSDEDKVVIDKNTYSDINLNLNKCELKNITTITVPNGETWDSVKVWASTGKDMIVLLDKDKYPTKDGSFGCSEGYAQKFRADREYDFKDYVDSRWKRIFHAGDKIYVGVFSYDGLSNEQFTIEIDKNFDKDGDGIPDDVDAFPNNFDEQYDTDKDGVGDNADAFPNDPAASVDSDGDGYPDSWNDGKTQSDSTTGLTLDKYPNDKIKWDDTTQTNTNILSEDFSEGLTNWQLFGSPSPKLVENVHGKNKVFDNNG